MEKSFVEGVEMVNILWAIILLGVFLVIGSVYIKSQEQKGWGYLLALGLWLAGGGSVIIIKYLVTGE